MTAIRIAFSTIDDAANAREIARQLVQEGLAACINIIPKVTSVYKWKGQVETEEECLMVIKSTEDRLGQLIDRLHEIHPYDVPEAVAFPVEKGHPPYLDWVVENTRG